MIKITPEQLKEHQLIHYAKRLEEETRFEVKVFLRNELFNLKKQNHD